MRIAVVGGGILGASVAFHAARAGAAVVVVDRAHAGRATAAGAGIICPWLKDDTDAAAYRLFVGAARAYPAVLASLAELGEHDLGYRQVGALCVSADADELAAIAALLERRRGEAPEIGEVALLAPQQARAAFPPLAAALGAVRIAGGARVDGRKLAAALLRGAQAHGAVLHQGEATLLAGAGRVTGLRLAAETIAADRVVVAAGAWAPALLRPLGLTLAVAPQRGQIVHLHLPGPPTDAWPVVLPQSAHYLLTFEDGRVVVGATRETGSGFDYRVTAGGLAEVLREALQVAPGLASATLIEVRVGFRPLGPDARPLLGWARGVEGLLIGNGLGPSGLTLGPFAGRLLAEAALGQAPALDLAPYDPLR
jgi:D-amino-acid dehydrogenase